MIEKFLQVLDDKIDNQPNTEKDETEKTGEASENHTNPTDAHEQDYIGTWVPTLDYFRMDGSTPPDLRSRWQAIFNDEENLRFYYSCFHISNEMY